MFAHHVGCTGVGCTAVGRATFDRAGAEVLRAL